MKLKFKDIPKSKEFETERKASFKPEDGIDSMLFAENMEIKMKVSTIRKEETKIELETLMDRTMMEAKKIIAKHETSQ